MNVQEFEVRGPCRSGGSEVLLMVATPAEGNC
jgi:hypothetical protein